MSLDNAPTVLVASDDPALLEEIIGFLQEAPRWKLVTALGPAAQLTGALESHLPEVVIISEALAGELCRKPKVPALRGAVIVVGRTEQTKTLKAALKLRARGFILWPKEKNQLKDLAESESSSGLAGKVSAGLLHAIWSPKGGSGASVIAAHLAASIAKLGAGCILVDLDLDHTDQEAILGAEASGQKLLDLIRMGDELTKSVVDSVTWDHPLGFKAILSAGSSGASSLVKPAELPRVFDYIKESTDHVLVDTPSGLTEIAMATMQESSSVAMVLTPDLLSLRRARDALKALLASGMDPSRFKIVLNQTGAAGLTRKDVKAVLGLEVSAEIPADLHLYQGINRSELSGAGVRMVSKLAAAIAGLPEPARSRGIRRGRS